MAVLGEHYNDPARPRLMLAVVGCLAFAAIVSVTLGNPVLAEEYAR